MEQDPLFPPEPKEPQGSALLPIIREGMAVRKQFETGIDPTGPAPLRPELESAALKTAVEVLDGPEMEMPKAFAPEGEGSEEDQEKPDKLATILIAGVRKIEHGMFGKNWVKDAGEKAKKLPIQKIVKKDSTEPGKSVRSKIEQEGVIKDQVRRKGAQVARELDSKAEDLEAKHAAIQAFVDSNAEVFGDGTTADLDVLAERVAVASVEGPPKEGFDQKTIMDLEAVSKLMDRLSREPKIVAELARSMVATLGGVEIGGISTRSAELSITEAIKSKDILLVGNLLQFTAKYLPALADGLYQRAAEIRGEKVTTKAAKEAAAAAYRGDEDRRRDREEDSREEEPQVSNTELALASQWMGNQATVADIVKIGRQLIQENHPNNAALIKGLQAHPRFKALDAEPTGRTDDRKY